MLSFTVCDVREQLSTTHTRVLRASLSWAGWDASKALFYHRDTQMVWMMVGGWISDKRDALLGMLCGPLVIRTGRSYLQVHAAQRSE